KASIGGKCQCCQRCVAFCGSKAIYVPGKPAAQYQGVGVESIMSLADESRTEAHKETSGQSRTPDR
ncbi:MAG: hypothetical protein LBO21_09020, partial [Synergistaceae bacterium]|nr:hypothetical protein [Synergistaceae bacterium]